MNNYINKLFWTIALSMCTMMGFGDTVTINSEEDYVNITDATDELIFNIETVPASVSYNKNGSECQFAWIANNINKVTFTDKVKEIQCSTEGIGLFTNADNLKEVIVIGTETKCAYGAFNNSAIKTAVLTIPSGTESYYLNPIFSFLQDATKLTDIFALSEEDFKNKYSSQGIECDNWYNFFHSGLEQRSQFFDENGAVKNTGSQFQATVNTMGDYAGWMQFVHTAYNNNVSPITECDRWYSLCIPETCQDDQYKKALGENTKVYKYVKMENSTFHFTELSQHIEANVAYMVKPGVGIKGIDIVARIPADKKANPNTSSRIATTANGWTFIGYYEGSIPADSYVWGWNTSKNYGTFARTNDGISNFTQFRAYITPESPSSAKGAMEMEAAFDMTTGTNRIVVGEEKCPVIYNLKGQRVTNPTRGIYITNGKKVMIK